MSIARQLIESALPVIKRARTEHDDECPHCHELIHEKGMAYRDGKWFHGACGGEIQQRELTPGEQSFLDSLAVAKHPTARGNPYRALVRKPDGSFGLPTE